MTGECIGNSILYLFLGFLIGILFFCVIGIIKAIVD